MHNPRQISRFSKQKLFYVFGIAVLVSSTILIVSNVAAQATDGYWFDVRNIDASDLDASSISGLAYESSSDSFVVVDNDNGRSGSDLIGISRYWDHSNKGSFSIPISNPLNFSYNEFTQSFYLIDDQTLNLVQVLEGSAANLSAGDMGIYSTEPHPMESMNRTG